MPIEYAGALAEHRAVRERVGLFDLTHLGKVEVAGPGALGMLQRRRHERPVTAPRVGEAHYNLVLNEGGGVIEDLIVYRLDEDRFFVVPNASNTPAGSPDAGGSARPPERSTSCTTRTGASSRSRDPTP